jgi:hypothetical protein
MSLAAMVNEEPCISSDFGDLVDWFLADRAWGLPADGPHDLTIKLKDSKQPPQSPIHNLSTKELALL